MTGDAVETTDDDRDPASEIRVWLMTYSGMSVSRHDAESLVDFLVKSGWTRPRVPHHAVDWSGEDANAK